MLPNQQSQSTEELKINIKDTKLNERPKPLLMRLMPGFHLSVAVSPFPFPYTVAVA